MNYSNPIFDKISDEKKHRIIQASIQEFSTHGFTKANINTIASEASVSVGSLYKYFNNKRELYLYIISCSVDVIKDVLSTIINDNDELLLTIRKIIRAIQSYTRQDEKVTRLYHVMTTETNPELVMQLATQMEGATADVYADLIKKFQGLGQIRDDIDPRYFAFFMDNIFMMLQFSYSCEYYKQRLKLYVNEAVFEDDALLEEELIQFISGAFKINHHSK